SPVVRARRAACRNRVVRRSGLKVGSDIDVVAFVDIHRAWLTELFPRGDKSTVLVEDLDAVVLTIGDVHVPSGADDIDVMRFPEVAGLRSHASPGLDELAVP